MIRVRDSGCSAYTSFVNLDSGLPVDWLPEPGVELQWASPKEPECGTQADCEGKSTCRSNLAVGVLVIDEQVDIEDEDDDAENNGDDDKREVEIAHCCGIVSATLDSNRIGEIEKGNQKLGLGM
ncbi:hypothetical protein ACFX13_021459 [Malus domestica]